jgi:peptidoglycan LD-endopeptidase CwlK
MYTSRSLLDLSPATRSKAVESVRCWSAAGLEVLVTCTFRDNEAQAALYASGRTVKGPLLTCAKPGLSLHNCVGPLDATTQKHIPAAQSFDVVPMYAGKCVWATTGWGLKLWLRVAEIGEACGLEWAGRWQGGFKEFPHFQNKGG